MHKSRKTVPNKMTMLRPNIKVRGMIWEFHKTDDDNWPSVPHGHSEDRKYKLELWSGNIYNVATRKLEYRAKKKEMKLLYNYPGFREFVRECREEYKIRNPLIVFPELSTKMYRYRRISTHNTKQNGYVFFIRHDRV